MTTPDDSMSGQEYRDLVARLGFAGDSPVDQGISAAGRFLGVSPRTGRDYAERGPNKSAAKLLRLMLALKLSPEAVDKAVSRKRRG